jgi:hypothetical protein
MGKEVHLLLRFIRHEKRRKVAKEFDVEKLPKKSGKWLFFQTQKKKKKKKITISKFCES